MNSFVCGVSVYFILQSMHMRGGRLTFPKKGKNSVPVPHLQGHKVCREVLDTFLTFRRDGNGHSGHITLAKEPQYWTGHKITFYSWYNVFFNPWTTLNMLDFFKRISFKYCNIFWTGFCIFIAIETCVTKKMNHSKCSPLSSRCIVTAVICIVLNPKARTQTCIGL